ncbi:hypothetical protein KC332_g4079 [Hortaea werneckii]|uniref:Retrovirus-related Pol polyprotein from transposon TNT 1-94-like beta-barrel domain-containing protein n=2 Tax=Hortaea werneckii TaxID=91943 RepID=A0A3M7IGL8_HORWE|nr:hypothetical protein KC358_g10869 [Hortaea werneckii]OTA27660.1 hypothetical protein BTJ68_11361 [Hortaea werneckii EXF-2000]KAI6847883.1 hypothetical protein KC350_g3242 [Hortaea werneckii]KAI6939465.1 hypothetical protein KC341_g4164 [Hortaea werneckii]KAI6941965.1 hypothetical protein KC348_g4546 [Hortaea werneckii]
MPSEMAEYWRDVRADRKRQQLEEAEVHDPSTRPCYDWYLHSGNVHFARDRSAFTSYVPLDATTLRSVAFDQTVGAVGIGHVELQVKVSPQSNETRTLQLRDVFHIPTAPCNGLSDMEIGIEHDLTVSYGRPYWKMYLSEPEGTPFCYGVTDRLFRLERADGLTGSRVRDDTSTLFSISTAVDDDVKMACRELYEAQNNGRR